MPVRRWRLLFILIGLLALPLLAGAQEIDVDNERFPGARRVKVQSYARGPAGFWAVYTFDDLGRAVQEKRYRGRRHLATHLYTYNQRHQVLRQATVFDVNPPHTEHNIFYTYRYNADSSRVLTEACYTDTDTLYVIHYLNFTPDNHPTRYTKARGWRRPPGSLTEVTYTAGHPTLVRRTDYDEAGETVYTLTSQYNAQGDQTNYQRAMSPEPKVTFWIDGQGDTATYAYDYSPQGPWVRQYQYFDGEKVLIERRTFKWAARPKPAANRPPRP